MTSCSYLPSILLILEDAISSECTAPPKFQYMSNAFLCPDDLPILAVQVTYPSCTDGSYSASSYSKVLFHLRAFVIDDPMPSMSLS